MAVTLLFSLVLHGAALPQEPEAASDRAALEAALRVAQWLVSCAQETDAGVTWPADPAQPGSTERHLYSGGAGVVLFFLELWHASGDETWLEWARRGADQLCADIEDPAVQQAAGLYVGIAGHGYVLEMAHHVTGEERFREAALRCVDSIEEHARPTGKGIQWNDVTDVVGGSAGTGLLLLWAAPRLEDERCLDLARKAGQRLLELGEPAHGGLRWKMSPTYERQMPNFSHGTAGIAYFLASLYIATRDGDFLQGAVDGARYLDAIARRDADTYRVFHHEPGGEDLYYLGWCHGPAGTARLFHRLWQITGDPRYRERVQAGARAIQRSGIPEARPEGFWNNVGQCCGSAGVASFLHHAGRKLSDPEHDRFAEQLTYDLLRRGTEDAQGLRWTHAEHRVRPELLQAQTGYMQGAAGIGLWLLHWDGAAEGRPRLVVLPDDPY